MSLLRARQGQVTVIIELWAVRLPPQQSCRVCPVQRSFPTYGRTRGDAHCIKQMSQAAKLQTAASHWLVTRVMRIITMQRLPVSYRRHLATASWVLQKEYMHTSAGTWILNPPVAASMISHVHHWCFRQSRCDTIPNSQAAVPDSCRGSTSQKQCT
jgi:hypothetical protein